VILERLFESKGTMSRRIGYGKHYAMVEVEGIAFGIYS
jgi:hypothetical protein